MTLIKIVVTVRCSTLCVFLVSHALSNVCVLPEEIDDEYTFQKAGA